MAHGCGFGAESRHAAFAGVALARAGARRSSAWGRVLRKSSVGTFRPTRGVSSPADPLVCSSPHSSLGKRPPPTPCNSAAHCSEGSNSLKLLSPCPQKNNTKNLLPGHDKPFALFLPAALTLAPRSSAEVRGGTCGDFYARVSRGNLDLLPRGSARRTGLLRGALACLVSGCRAGGGRCSPPPPNPSPRVCTRAGLCLPGGEEQPPAPRAARQPRGTGVRHGARDHHGLGSRRPGEPEALLSAGGGPAGCPQCRAPRGGHGIRVRSPRLLLRGVGVKQKGWRSHEDAELVLLPMATGILRAGIYRLCKIWGRSSWL